MSCPECNKEFDSKESLLLHIGLGHELFWCDICKETFRKQNLLRKHNKQFHNSNKTSRKNRVIQEREDQPNNYESIVEEILNKFYPILPSKRVEERLIFFIQIQKFWF